MRAAQAAIIIFVCSAGPTFCVFSVTCHSCTAITLSDVNCTSEWVEHSVTGAYDDQRHRTASTLAECQNACEFDPRCVAIDWSLDQLSDGTPVCELNTYANHGHGTPTGYRKDHYELASRCNITPGQYFYHTMHFSAMRSIEIACRLSVCPSVCP